MRRRVRATQVRLGKICTLIIQVSLQEPHDSTHQPDDEAIVVDVRQLRRLPPSKDGPIAGFFPRVDEGTLALGAPQFDAVHDAYFRIEHDPAS